MLASEPAAKLSSAATRRQSVTRLYSLAQDKVHNLRDARTLVVGTGEMRELAAEALYMHGVRSIPSINRTEANAQALAQRVQGRALAWPSLPEALAWADVVITATGAPYPIIHVQDVSRVLPQRHGRPLVLVDIAIPRDVEETIGDLSEVYCYDIDDLHAVLDTNHAQRAAAIPEVEAIIEDEMARFVAWLHHRQVVPIIADMRGKALALADDEVKQALRQLEGLPERDQRFIARLAHRIVNKLLHTPTMCLKAHTIHGNNSIRPHSAGALCPGHLVDNCRVRQVEESMDRERAMHNGTTQIEEMFRQKFPHFGKPWQK